MTNITKLLVKGCLIILDLLITCLLLIIIYILFTGGGEFQFNHTFIRFYSARNLMILVFILLPLRFLARKHSPFLAVKKMDFQQLPHKALKIVTGLYQRLETLKRIEILKILLAILLVSTMIKLLNAWFYYGFFSGDDVEVYEMTFSHLFNWEWQAWNLRGAIYPMVFIYPLQVFLTGLGISGSSALVFSGRLIVICFSILNILLVFKITSRLLKSTAAGVLAAFFLGFSQLHISFAASILPRTVASTFILFALLLLVTKPKNTLFASLAGVSLAIGSVIRFSEAIFIVPCLVYLIWEKRFRDAVWVSIFSLIAGLSLQGIGDLLYWGEPFYSLKHIIRYTLVDKLSSRGYQSVLYYFYHIGQWTNVFWAALILPAFSRKYRYITSWAIIPLVLLSILPHKEPRYLVPIIPFMAILTGIGLWQWAGKIVRNNSRSLPRKQLLALLLVFTVISSFLFESDGFRFRRSESAVDAARYLMKQKNIKCIAIEQAWRAGGKIYLYQIPDIINISTDSIGTLQYFLKVIDPPAIEYVLLKDRSVKKYNYDQLLIKKGFEEVYFKQGKREKYRLFKNKAKLKRTQNLPRQRISPLGKPCIQPIF